VNGFHCFVFGFEHAIPEAVGKVSVEEVMKGCRRCCLHLSREGGRLRGLLVRCPLVAWHPWAGRGDSQEHQHAHQQYREGSPGICHLTDRGWALLVVERCLAVSSLLPGVNGEEGFGGRRFVAFEEVHDGRFGPRTDRWMMCRTRSPGRVCRLDMQ